MLFSDQIWALSKKYGPLRATEMMAEAGFPAVDFSMFDHKAAPFTDDYRKVAEELLKISERTGVRFVQAHAPFGGGIDNYMSNLVPLLPRALEFCHILGIPNIVVHPLQTGRYYGNEDKLYEMNMRFYSALAPLSKQNGVKIAIENMWQRHPVTGRIVDDVCAPPEELVRYYDGLSDPDAFTVCLDIGHVALCGREPEDAIRIIGKERLGCLHVHDNDYINDSHTLPCVGKINWERVVEALGDIGYDGVFNMECDSYLANFPEEYYPTALRFAADTAKMLSEKVETYKR